MATDTKGKIVNKVKQSDKLVTIDLQQYYDDTPKAELDLKQFLFKGMILKEQDFREQLEQFDWTQFEDQYVAVYCSTDAIISKWAYMLVGQYLVGYAKEVFKGQKDDMLFELFRRNLDEVDWDSYKDKFVILKGCSSKEKPVPESIYLYATQRLVPHVKKLMYGEACSNVPVYRA
jgi:hypothetical protein